MTREETLQVLSILKAAYPHSYRNMTRLDAEAAVNLWHRQFENEDAAAVSMAVDALIATRKEGYSPTVGEVKEQLHRVRTEDSLLSDAEAWGLVEKACPGRRIAAAVTRSPAPMTAGRGEHEPVHKNAVPGAPAR